MSQSGTPLRKSSLDSAWQRMIAMALKEKVIDAETRFGLHGLKHRRITDTPGNRGDKQDAAGHANPETTNRPRPRRAAGAAAHLQVARSRRIFPGNFPGS